MRYDEQVRRVALAAQKSIEIETAKFNKELALKAQEAAKILQLEQQKVVATINGAAQTLGITATFWQNMVLIAQRATAALANSQGAKIQTNPNVAPNKRPGKSIPTLQDGGRILESGYAFLHSGETVIPARNRNQGQGNIVFAPQINGMNKTQVRRELTRQMDIFIQENFA